MDQPIYDPLVTLAWHRYFFVGRFIMLIGAEVAVVILLAISEYRAEEITCMPTTDPRHRGSEASGSHAHQGIHGDIESSGDSIKVAKAGA